MRFNETIHNQVWIPARQWYTRAKVRLIQRGARCGGMKYQILKGMQFPTQCCLRGYNLEDDRQVYCVGCNHYVHVEELVEKAECERDIPDVVNTHLRVQNLPMIRGGGWMEDLLALGFKPGDVELWIQVGSRGLLVEDFNPSDPSHPEVLIGWGSTNRVAKAVSRCAAIIETVSLRWSWKCPACGGLI